MFSLKVVCWSVLTSVDSKKVFFVRLLNANVFDKLVHARISQCLERHDVTLPLPFLWVRHRQWRGVSRVDVCSILVSNLSYSLLPSPGIWDMIMQQFYSKTLFRSWDHALQYLTNLFVWGICVIEAPMEANIFPKRQLFDRWLLCRNNTIFLKCNLCHEDSLN